MRSNSRVPAPETVGRALRTGSGRLPSARLLGDLRETPPGGRATGLCLLPWVFKGTRLWLSRGTRRSLAVAACKAGRRSRRIRVSEIFRFAFATSPRVRRGAGALRCVSTQRTSRPVPYRITSCQPSEERVPSRNAGAPSCTRRHGRWITSCLHLDLVQHGEYDLRSSFPLRGRLRLGPGIRPWIGSLGGPDFRRLIPRYDTLRSSNRSGGSR